MMRIIFDNGGGVTLQAADYAHYYLNATKAARDFMDYMENGSDGFEGYEEETAELDPSDDEIRNGGYRIYSPEEIIEEAKLDNLSGWFNIDNFCLELSKK